MIKFYLRLAIVFKHAAVMASFGAPLGEDPSSTKLCNNLIANLTGMQTGSPTDLQEGIYKALTSKISRL